MNEWKAPLRGEEWQTLRRNKKAPGLAPQAQTAETKRGVTRRKTWPAGTATQLHLPEPWGPKGLSLSQARLTQHTEKHLILKAWNSEMLFNKNYIENAEPFAPLAAYHNFDNS